MARTAHQRLYPSLSDPIYLSLKDLRVAVARHAPQASGVSRQIRRDRGQECPRH